ncbi:FAD-dependent oxidoreductase [Mucilaginibacter robiniae]|uniref:Tryptophan 2-monooxygenase n=1 Tax=Mucilaginibacter robiniae TaxID=2728022 RepID=A0A7L5E0Y7_9SPHI|nr:NAD(P)/FAD-dependent oxidoreductase [Mucilaginibacter robiniae]QJD94483.1 FAD-dependent oxidoreductase [Mucilaginibacter robiniae]
MEQANILVIGAGAAGLMAAYTLAKAGKRVTVLEACNRTGGRIHTIDRASFFKHAELGAEFVHGNLPLTLGLLQQANIAYHPIGGEMWQYRAGTFTQDAGMIEGWDLLMKKMNAQQEDATLNEFLEQHFVDPKFEELKDSVRRYAGGYDTGDPDRISVLALQREWQNEDEDAQYRIEGGYCALIQYLVAEFKAAGGAIYLNAPVKEVHWQPGQVKVYTADKEQYEAKQIILALPLGVWQAPADTHGAISFSPGIDAQTEALQQLGFGSVIKILLRFDTIFWEDEVTEELVGHSLKNMEFLFSDEVVPTWWTQLPQHTALLTGWLAGPASQQWANASPEEILQQSLQSLAHVFNRSPEELKAHLIAWHVANWTAEPYTRGSYTYDTVQTPQALQVLSEPIADTIYLAGEFMYQGTAMGTVEAALVSGRNAVQKILGLI